MPARPATKRSPDHLPANLTSMGLMDKVVLLLKPKNKKANEELIAHYLAELQRHRDACPTCQENAHAAQVAPEDVDDQCVPNITMPPEDEEYKKNIDDVLVKQGGSSAIAGPTKKAPKKTNGDKTIRVLHPRC